MSGLKWFLNAKCETGVIFILLCLTLILSRESEIKDTKHDHQVYKFMQVTKDKFKTTVCTVQIVTKNCQSF